MVIKRGVCDDGDPHRQVARRAEAVGTALLVAPVSGTAADDERRTDHAATITNAREFVKLGNFTGRRLVVLAVVALTTRSIGYCCPFFAVAKVYPRVVMCNDEKNFEAER
jgi:hypothetical protein